MGENGNGKWEIAFWVVTVICGIWLLALTEGVVANEKLNTQKHEDIMSCLGGRLNSIDIKLARIDSKLEK